MLRKPLEPLITCRVTILTANVVLTSPSGLMKTFPDDISVENSSHGELGNGVGNSRTPVKSILLYDTGYVMQPIMMLLKDSCSSILTLLPDLIREERCN